MKSRDVYRALERMLNQDWSDWMEVHLAGIEDEELRAACSELHKKGREVIRLAKLKSYEQGECAHGNPRYECQELCNQCQHACYAHDVKFGCKGPGCQCNSSAGQWSEEGIMYR